MEYVYNFESKINAIPNQSNFWKGLISFNCFVRLPGALCSMTSANEWGRYATTFVCLSLPTERCTRKRRALWEYKRNLQLVRKAKYIYSHSKPATVLGLFLAQGARCCLIKKYRLCSITFSMPLLTTNELGALESNSAIKTVFDMATICASRVVLLCQQKWIPFKIDFKSY